MRKVISLILLVAMAATIFIMPAPAAAQAAEQAPVLFFSDLESGPNTGGENNKGAYVTIWGKNFGDVRGDSYVTVGGSQADNYPIWSDTKITFQLGPNAATGDIKVVTSGGTSNGLPFTVRSGNIYFVKTTGNDNNSGSWDNPWRTIRKAKNSLAPGDIAYICDGVSQTAIDDYSACLNLNSSGLPGAPKALVAYPGATASIGSPSARRAILNWVSGYGLAGSYWVISQFNILPGYEEHLVTAAEGTRIIGNRLTYSGGQWGSSVIRGVKGPLSILGNEIYDVTQADNSTFYGILLNGETAGTYSDVEIGWNVIRDSQLTSAICVQSNPNCYFSNVNIHDNLIYNIRSSGISISSYSTGDCYIYNNIIYNCGIGPDYSSGPGRYCALYIGNNDVNAKVYNNTFSNCGFSGTPNEAQRAASGLLNIRNFTGTLDISNNIFYETNSYPYMVSGSQEPATGAYHNLFFGSGPAPAWDTAAVNGDPQFVDADGADFHLKAISPAIDAGIDVTDVAPNDFDGVARPKGAAVDIGAFEFAAVPESIELDSYAYTLEIGEVHNTEVTAVYPDGSSRDVTAEASYRSSAPEIASVDASGTVTAHNVGVAEITAEYMGMTAKVEVTVTRAVWFAKNDFVLGTHNLGTGNTGILTVDFDITPLVSSMDAMVGYGDSSIVMDSYGKFLMIIRLNTSGIFDVRNGGSYSYLNQVSYQQDTKYHVRMVTNLVKREYDVYVAPYIDDDTLGEEIMIAEDFAFRTSAIDSEPKSDDLGQICLYCDQQGVNDVFKIENHKVTTTVALSSIALDRSTYELNAGSDANVSVTATLANGEEYVVTSASTYVSSAPDIAAVSTEGKITALKQGTAELTAFYGGKQATANIIVTPPVLTGITLDSSLYIVSPGGTRSMTVTAHYGDGSSVDVTDEASYEISAPEIASVDRGVITGITEGTATITVAYQGMTATADVSVEPLSLTGISLDMDVYNLAVGATHNTEVTAHYSDGSTEDVTAQATYESSAPEIASVDASGTVRGISAGTAIITVAFEGKTAIATVFVEEAGAKPVLFFSDLESGPNTGGENNKGAYVTIWGKNFGDVRGDSYVTVGGGRVDNYPIWSDTKITFQLGPNAATGDIKVVTFNGTSNGLPFTVRSGNIYFVKTTGNDNNSGSWDNPWRTIRKAKNSLAPGDIAYICDGVNQTTPDDYNAALNLNSSGTPTHPKALVVYPGASSTIGATEGQYLNLGIRGFISGGGSAKYWVISQFNVRATEIAIDLFDGTRIVGCDISVPNGSGASAAFCGIGNGYRILGNVIHDNGRQNCSKLYHHVYLANHSGQLISDIEIAWNIIRDGNANRGIQIYVDNTNMAPVTDVRIHDNVIKNIRGNAINIGSYCTGEFQIYNNLIINCARGPIFPEGDTDYSGIYINNNDANVKVYNNTIYNCGYSAGTPSAYQRNTSGSLHISGCTGVISVKNNIFYQTIPVGNPYSYMIYYSDDPASGANHNLFYGSGPAPAWDTAAVEADPLFADAANGDFRLTEGSPAIDNGTPDTLTVAPLDFDGNQRPAGSGVDIGAYEYSDVQGGEPQEEPKALIWGSGTVTPDTEFTVGISLTGDISDVYAEEITVTYDDDLFDFMGAEAAAANVIIVTAEETEPGKIVIIAGNEGGISGETHILDLTFRSKSLQQTSSGFIRIIEAELGIAPQGTTIDAETSEIEITVSAQAVNKSALIAAIEVANLLYADAVEGDLPGQYPEGSKAVLLAAINEAKAVRDDPDATQAEVDNALQELNAAVTAFQALVRTVDKCDLNADGSVNIGDLAIAIYYYRAKAADPVWNEASIADMNGDEIIDIEDLAYIALRIIE